MRVHLFTQLQHIDQQLAALAQERDVLLDAFRERDTIRELRDARRDLASKLKGERGHSSDLQWELDDVELRLRTLDEQERDGPTDPLVARELVILRERAAQLEEHVLAQLEHITGLEQELHGIEQQVEQATSAWAGREPLLQSQLDRLGHDLEALQTQRQSIADQLPEGALELYDDLQRRHRGTALAPIRNRQCSACRARLPAAVFDLLNTSDPLVRCPRCGRVLYIESAAAE
jgi:uncharacterized protein